ASWWTISSKPASSSHCVTACRMAASSSTNRMGIRSGMGGLLGERGFGHQARQLDHHFGATLRTIGRVNAAAKVLHDAVGDGEAKAKPLADRLGGDERIEDLLDQFGGNAGSVVGDHNTHRFGRRGGGYLDRGALHLRHC